MTVEKILLTEEEKKNIIPYKTIIIIIIIIIRSIENYFDFRQYRRLKENRPIPKELISFGLKQSNHEESQKYSLEKIKLSIFSSIFKNILTILFIYYNVNPLQYNISQKLCIYIPFIKFNPENEYGPLFCFLFFEIIFMTILELPFELYKTFILDEKFGINKTTLNTFIKDQIKELIIALIVYPLVISPLVYIIIKGGKYFYIFTEIFAIVLLFIFMWAYPNIIQPLFNKFKEINEGDLKNGIMELANRVNYPLKKIYEMDASQRSAHSNAYLFGFGKNKRIVLYDTLIKNLSIKEIEGVLGHEFGHYAKWHIVILSFVSFANIFIIFFILQFFINEIVIYISFGFEQKSIFIGLYLFSIIFSPFTFFINIIQNCITRKLEYQADEYSYELGYKDYLIRALCKLYENNKSDLDPDHLYSIVNNSHPTLIERIRALNKYQDDKKEN